MPAPLTPALNTRFRVWSPLSEDEVPFFKSRISQKEHKIEKVDSQIERVEARILSLQQELKQLKRRRILLRKNLVAHQAFMAPIRTLPLEILLEIFFLVCTINRISYQEAEEYEPSDSGSDAEGYTEVIMTGYSHITLPPLVLSQVCSTWYNLVRRSNSLWLTGLSLCLDITSQAVDARYSIAVKKTEDALAYVLRHLGDAPLRVFLTLSEDGIHKMEIDSLLGCFFTQSHRWKEAKLVIDHEDLHLRGFLCAPMPALETLTLSLQKTDFAEPEIDHLFCQAPSLRNVTFRSSHAFAQSTLLWSGLHTLVFDIPLREPYLQSIPRLTEVLSECKSLRLLSWDARLCDWRSYNKDPVIVPVTSLVAASNIDDLLPHVTLPNLKTFDLHLERYRRDDVILSSEQEKYRDRITGLKVEAARFMVMTTRVLFSRLGSFPNVRTLNLTHCYGEEREEGMPACDSTEIPCRFPNLEILTYALDLRSGHLVPAFNYIISLLKAFQQSTVDSSASLSKLRKVQLKFSADVLSKDQRLLLRDLQPEEDGPLLEVRDRNGTVDVLSDGV